MASLTDICCSIGAEYQPLNRSRYLWKPNLWHGELLFVCLCIKVRTASYTDSFLKTSWAGQWFTVSMVIEIFHVYIIISELFSNFNHKDRELLTRSSTDSPMTTCLLNKQYMVPQLLMIVSSVHPLNVIWHVVKVIVIGQVLEGCWQASRPELSPLTSSQTGGFSVLEERMWYIVSWILRFVLSKPCIVSVLLFLLFLMVYSGS